jgi:hypothetical protein
LSLTQNQKLLRSHGRIDKNGFPILDPPGERNKLRKRCHDRMHQFHVKSDHATGRVDVFTDYEEHRIVKECRICGYYFTETKWV